MDTLGGFSAPVGSALRRQLTSATPGVEVTVVDFFEEYLPSLSVLARLAYTQDRCFVPGGAGTLESALVAHPDSPILRALRSGALDRLGDFVRAGDFQLIIGTSPVAASAAAELPAHARPPVVSVIPGFTVKDLWLHPYCDLYFVATKEVQEDLVMTGIPYSRVVVSGVPSMLPPDAASREELRKANGLADRFTAVVGTASGAHVDVGRCASALAGHGVQVVVAIGSSDRTARQLAAAERSTALVRTFESTAAVRAVMLGDVVVARPGGALLLESVCSSTPSVLYTPVPEQEIANVDFLLNSGVSMLARDEEDVIEKVRFLSAHPGRLTQMRAAAAGVGRMNAVRIVADRMAALIR